MIAIVETRFHRINNFEIGSNTFRGGLHERRVQRFDEAVMVKGREVSPTVRNDICKLIVNEVNQRMREGLSSA
jgi:hypothetical protein